MEPGETQPTPLQPALLVWSDVAASRIQKDAETVVLLLSTVVSDAVSHGVTLSEIQSVKHSAGNNLTEPRLQGNFKSQ